MVAFPCLRDDNPSSLVLKEFGQLAGSRMGGAVEASDQPDAGGSLHHLERPVRASIRGPTLPTQRGTGVGGTGPAE